MTRAGLSPERVVAEAGALADERGIHALSLAPLAERLGVRVPSLYKHVGGLEDLHRRLALAGIRDVTDVLGAATVGRSGLDALRACATAWRAYAKEHPGRYGAIQRAPDRADAELAVAGSRLTELLLAVLRGYGLDEDGTVHATRAVRSALHGFITLEAEGGFGLSQDVDVSYDRLVTLLDAGLTRPA
ncbi:MAG TPA: WHG domain-containing protein [Mycobacteriales bacterium]|nr:WHG domain-containing protein [Mycobacteriales bacterium]